MKKIFIAASFFILYNSCLNQPVYRHSDKTLEVYRKNKVNLDKYLGTWYEIYRLPNNFEKKDCVDVTAQYSFKSDGSIKVINSCTLVNGIVDTVEGKAKVVDSSTNAKLKVSFFGPFYGDYWILDLADDYSWSIVGEPEGKYLWVLSREKKLKPEVEEYIMNIIKNLGYDVNDLIKTKQN